MNDLDFLISFLKKFYNDSGDKFCNKIEEFSDKVRESSKRKIGNYTLKEYHYEGLFYWTLFEDNFFCGFLSFEIGNNIIKGDLIKVNSKKIGNNLGLILFNELVELGKKNNFEKIIGEPDETYMPQNYFKKLGWDVNNSYMEYKLK